MKVAEVMSRLESLGSEKVRKLNCRNGASDNQFGVQLGQIRKIAKEIKTNPELAEELWATGNLDARLLAILILKPQNLSVENLEAKVEEADFTQIADWLNSYVVHAHPQNEDLRIKWLACSHPAKLRSAWSLTARRVAKNPQGLDIPALLDRIEKEMGDAPELVQWTMNFCLAEIGINHAEFRARAIAIGEKLGVYRDYPTPKGCTSPFAPIWINAIVSKSATAK
ncbi:DNA alkylation repair protein [Kamptonema cortianum]|nr:DNA alkylation repair protein [Geitlerinema splendidum]MDK3158604.1 DNA alkylation repair protein [Kamptonema cortianum]